ALRAAPARREGGAAAPRGFLNPYSCGGCPMVRSLCCRVCVAAVLAGLLLGCSSGKTHVSDFSDQEKHMKRVASLYSGYKGAKGAVPQKTEELKTWVKALKKEELDTRGVTDVDKALVGPRDGKELVIVPTPKNAKMGMSKIIAYERDGVSGKHWTLGSQGHVTEVTEEELEQLLSEVGQKRIR